MCPFYQLPKTSTSKPAAQRPLNSDGCVASRPVPYSLMDLRLSGVHSFPSPEYRPAAAGSPPASTCSFSISCPVPLPVSGPHPAGLWFSNNPPLECHCPFWPAACTAYGCERHFPGQVRSYTSAFPAPRLSHVTIIVYCVGLQTPFQAVPAFQEGVLPTPPISSPALLST